MTSIPHFEDMSVQQIYDSLDLEWTVSEKLDGSSLQAGLDEQGQFYSQRKGGQPVYDTDEWPDEVWASTFRRAHAIASCIIEALVIEKIIQPGNWIGFEIIENELPNSIPYKNFHMNMGDMPDATAALVITHTNWTPSKEFYYMFSKDRTFTATSSAITMSSLDGIDGFQTMEDFSWMVSINPHIGSDWVKARLSDSANMLKLILDHWLPLVSNIEGFTHREILEINLSKKHPKAGTRNWNELRKEIGAERTRLKKIFDATVLLFKEAAYRVTVNESGSSPGVDAYKEGAVVESSVGKFKLVDRKAYTALNKFTHRVKYAVVGGSRPPKPSFLSRTKDWPVEKRLARLDILLTRYMKWRYLLFYTGTMNGRILRLAYHGALHSRTLGMFYDTRKRIENGR